MSITEDERARGRHHLGYMQVQEASTFVLGVPSGVQTAFMIEGAGHSPYFEQPGVWNALVQDFWFPRP